MRGRRMRSASHQAKVGTLRMARSAHSAYRSQQYNSSFSQTRINKPSTVIDAGRLQPRMFFFSLVPIFSTKSTFTFETPFNDGNTVAVSRLRRQHLNDSSAFLRIFCVVHWVRAFWADTCRYCRCIELFLSSVVDM